jgi:hypothetical protein
VPDPKRYFVSSMYDIQQDDRSWNKFKASFYRLLISMQSGLPSWRLLAGLSAFTDLPNGVLNLWRLNSPAALAEGIRYFEDDKPRYDDLIEVCNSPGVELLEAMPYDPDYEPQGASTTSTSPDGRFYFLWVELTLRPGKANRDAFVGACIALLAKMQTDLPEWTLVAAGSSVTGRPCTVMHLWRLHDSNSLLDGMNWFGENNPDYMALAKTCLRQRQDLFTSMFYNPLGQNGRLSRDDRKHNEEFNSLLLSLKNKG